MFQSKEESIRMAKKFLRKRIGKKRMGHKITNSWAYKTGVNAWNMREMNPALRNPFDINYPKHRAAWTRGVENARHKAWFGKNQKSQPF
jgi:hypothetical protein